MPVSTIINIGNPEHYTKVRLPNNTTLFVLNQYLQKETKTRSRVSDFVPKPKEIEIIVPEIEPEIIEEEPEVRPFYLSTLNIEIFLKAISRKIDIQLNGIIFTCFCFLF